MLIEGPRATWEEWTGVELPDDGEAAVAGGLVPVSSSAGTASTASRACGCGTRVTSRRA